MTDARDARTLARRLAAVRSRRPAAICLALAWAACHGSCGRQIERVEPLAKLLWQSSDAVDGSVAERAPWM
eukprot:3899439-Prymnesium_polylepis.1